MLLFQGMLRGVAPRGCECLIGTLTIFILLCLAVDAAPPRDDSDLHEPSDVVTVRGRVAHVETLPRAGGGPRDLIVVFETGIADEIHVAVAPHWVTKAMGLQLHEGDHIQVTGWRIVRGKPALLAAEIGKGTQLFVFRDRHGVAVWGPRRRLKPPPAHRVEQPD